MIMPQSPLVISNNASMRIATCGVVISALVLTTSMAGAATATIVTPAFDDLPARGVAAFPVLSGPDHQQALACLTSAVYYEAANEPTIGQQAVAQVVLNRVRHPNYPKSVCGVVNEGSTRVTGCQFSFTCDGSLRRRPVATLWLRAQEVAEAALDGFVSAEAGTATHYHAAWMRPWWASSLISAGQIGGHIFYRLPGPLRSVAASSGPDAGRDSELAAMMTARAPGLEAPNPRSARRQRPRPAAFSPWGLTVAVVQPGTNQ